MNRKYEEVVTEYITDSINDSAMDILIDCTEDIWKSAAMIFQELQL